MKMSLAPELRLTGKSVAPSLGMGHPRVLAAWQSALATRDRVALLSSIHRQRACFGPIAQWGHCLRPERLMQWHQEFNKRIIKRFASRV